MSKLSGEFIIDKQTKLSYFIKQKVVLPHAH